MKILKTIDFLYVILLSNKSLLIDVLRALRWLYGNGEVEPRKTRGSSTSTSTQQHMMMGFSHQHHQPNPQANNDHKGELDLNTINWEEVVDQIKLERGEEECDIMEVDRMVEKSMVLEEEKMSESGSGRMISQPSTELHPVPFTSIHVSSMQSRDEEVGLPPPHPPSSYSPHNESKEESYHHHNHHINSIPTPQGPPTLIPLSSFCIT